jgi:hypothetical protein
LNELLEEGIDCNIDDVNLKNHSEISPLLEKSEILLEKDKSLDIDQKFWKSLETMSSVEKEKFPEKLKTGKKSTKRGYNA